MKNLVYIVALLASISVHAQQIGMPFWSDDGVEGVATEFYAGGSASQLNNAFINRLLFDEHLDRSVILNQELRMKGVSRMGVDYLWQNSAVFRVGSGPWHGVVSASDQAHVSAGFPKSFYQIMFNGNAAYAGTELDFSGVSMQSIRFQRAGLGLKWQAEQQSAGFLVSVVNARQGMYLNLDRGRLRTSALGDTLTANINGQWYRSDSIDGRMLGRAGGGVSIDLFLQRVIHSNRGKWRFQAQALNLGWVQWHPGGSRYLVDTTLVFRGLEVNDLGASGTSIEEFSAMASLESDVRTRSTQNYMLPGWAQVTLQQRKARGLEWGGGMVWRWHTAAKAYGFVRAAYRWNEFLEASAECGMGGYGKLQAGVGVRYGGRHWQAQLGVGNIEALIFSQRFAGATLRAGFAYKWTRKA
jgi:hypothetical protein